MLVLISDASFWMLFGNFDASFGILAMVFDNKMDTLNKYYYHILLSTSFIYLVNMLLTIKMIKDNYHGNSTVSCFTSFSLLVLMKLYNSFTVAYQSVKNDKMMSAYMWVRQ